MPSVNIPCKKCKVEKTYWTSFIEVPIKVLFFCENDECRSPNGVILKFNSRTELVLDGRYEVGLSNPVPFVLGDKEIPADDELAELV